MQPCTNRHCNALRQNIEDYQRQVVDLERRLEDAHNELEAAQDSHENQIGSLEVQLFHSHKETKKYGEVERLYFSIMKAVDLDTCEDPEILEIRYTFAESLIEQGRSQEAEKISKAVFDYRKKDWQSEEFKQSHRQLCEILSHLRNFDGAKKIQREMYEDHPDDDWRLENGDELCKTLSAQGDHEQAKMLQKKVWSAREARNGPRHHLTIQSGLRRIENLENLVPLNIYDVHKQSFEADIKQDLERIWATRLQPAPENSPDILNVGLKLGDICMLKGEFGEAENIFRDVWAGQKSVLGVNHITTMSIGTRFGQALKRQETPQKYQEAAIVFRDVWNTKQSVMKKSDEETISSAITLASIYSSLGKWAEAEPIYQWILYQRKKKPAANGSAILNITYDLGKTLYRQGKARYGEAGVLLKEVYHEWEKSSPDPRLVLECGCMVAEALSAKSKERSTKRSSEENLVRRLEKVCEALDFLRGALGRAEAWKERDITYLFGGRLYGSLLIEAEEFPEAQKTLSNLWAIESKTPQEKTVLLECGRLYGESLYKIKEPPPTKEALEKARDVLNEVLQQHDTHLGETPEITCLREHLQEVLEKIKATQKVPKSRPSQSKGKSLFRR